ncbi:MAG: pyruvate kinase [Desulfobulbaceae bacterium]|nr:pyruvate kinase [Desulfobulbaceae bacterium]HIJ80027.1 pyruvate kinase [Deltaproteobacteria bacterium]
MRNTKIICTIGPRTASYEMLKQLAENGMDVARLNMSHGSYDWHRTVIHHIKRLNKKLGGALAILLDTKGPEVRTGDVCGDMHLKKGEQLILTVRRQAELEAGTVEVSYDGFVNEVEVGDTVLIDGGMISLKVRRIVGKDIYCDCLDDAVLTSRRHVNIRGKSADLPSITDKDWEDIRFGIENGVDFIALSFVRTAESITEVRKYIQAEKASIDILAKIESAEAIPHLDKIIDRSDGIMIARGDLGAELPFEEVPLLQEEIVAKCRAAGKPVIVATHMLESMIVNPTPTRAEVTDITQAVLQGADATMLSGETATGKYPLKALNAMDTVARRIELKLGLDPTVRVAATENSKYEIARSASILNNNLHADAILVFTRRGLMAMMLSRCRPSSPIYAFTNTTNVRRRLGIFWGLHPFLIKLSNDPEVSITRALDKLLHRQLLKPGNRVIVVSDILAGEKFVETVQVRII